MNTAERIARAFHDAYEELAPGEGWETQERSRKPWDEVPEANRRVMIATVKRLLANRHISAIPALGFVVTPEQATEEKGYPHPGNTIWLPDHGGEPNRIRLQYGHPDKVGRNGCYIDDVLKGLIANLEVYQAKDHPMRCVDTSDTLEHLRNALACVEHRRESRKRRGVHQTDEA